MPASDTTLSMAAIVVQMLAFRDEHGPVLGDAIVVRKVVEEGRRLSERTSCLICEELLDEHPGTRNVARLLGSDSGFVG